MLWLDVKGVRQLSEWLTGTDAIKYMKISRSTFYRLVRQGKITPYYLPGIATPRYKRAELDALFTPKPGKEGQPESEDSSSAK